jgi:hypothetical protein
VARSHASKLFMPLVHPSTLDRTTASYVGERWSPVLPRSGN